MIDCVPLLRRTNVWVVDATCPSKYMTEDTMARRTIMIVAVAALGSIAGNAWAQHLAPNALLTIDQNRATVIERIVGEWGDRLESSNAGVDAAQLRQILSGLRADHLLAASLAGSVEGLRDVVSGALVRTDAAVSPALKHTKALGDTTDDLVYTPVVPCRIVDTRLGAGGVFAPQTQRNWLAFSPGGFAAQGGSATNCGIPVRPVAVMFNPTLANTVGGPEFVTFWPSNQARPLAASVNWWGPGAQPANAQIVPLCTGGGCTADFSAYASGQTHVIIDILGYFNRPTNYGGTHTITGQFATDSGGQNNTATGNNSTVGGGSLNTASGDSSTVAGGNNNTASGISSNVAGGFTNTAVGNESAVPGGTANIANGSSSLAAGFHANADFDGCFVWGDTTTVNVVQCGAPNRFVVRAEGGIYMFAGNDGTNMQGHYTGVTLAPGSQAWIAASDRAGKDNLRLVDTKDVLRKVTAMPIATWNWKSQDTSIRHMGPMAQDFHAAFGLGETPKGISTIDADGVALAAIQGLHQLLKQKDTKLSAQQRKITAMERELALIKEKLNMR
ncbi:MAG: hypothetical protein E6H67_18910 [Betaproteobacteria bacterium]|nr:MAG: hypothetical protein E6H67_18910 [Betaproteobacteria bacterium]